MRAFLSLMEAEKWLIKVNMKKSKEYAKVYEELLVVSKELKELKDVKKALKGYTTELIVKLERLQAEEDELLAKCYVESVVQGNTLLEKVAIVKQTFCKGDLKVKKIGDISNDVTRFRWDYSRSKFFEVGGSRSLKGVPPFFEIHNED